MTINKYQTNRNRIAEVGPRYQMKRDETKSETCAYFAAIVTATYQTPYGDKKGHFSYHWLAQWLFHHALQSALQPIQQQQQQQQHGHIQSRYTFRRIWQLTWVVHAICELERVKCTGKWEKAFFSLSTQRRKCKTKIFKSTEWVFVVSFLLLLSVVVGCVSKDSSSRSRDFKHGIEWASVYLDSHRMKRNDSFAHNPSNISLFQLVACCCWFHLNGYAGVLSVFHRWIRKKITFTRMFNVRVYIGLVPYPCD